MDDRVLHVLLADDNAINQMVARRALQKAGCTVDTVDSGEAAVAAVAERSFDAVFMDCQMPVMDGYEATRRIRQMEARAALPIVAITANAMPGDRERCFAAGMTDYIAKPIQQELVHAAVDRVRRQFSLRAAQRAPASATPTFGRDEIWQIFDGDADIVRELIALIVRDVPAYVGSLADCVSAGDLAAVARTAHTIAGSVGNVGATTALEFARSLESHARSGDALALPAVCGALEEATAHLVRDLQAWDRELEEAAARGGDPL